MISIEYIEKMRYYCNTLYSLYLLLYIWNGHSSEGKLKNRWEVIMRSDIVNPTGEDNELHLESGNYLTDAVNWFKENEIPLYGIQTNPTQHTWTTSPKAYAQMYIDDAALGCPLKYDKEFAERPFVDWFVVRDMLKWNGLLA